VAQAFEARDEVIVAELCLGGILAASVPAARFVALPRYPAVSRDLSILHEQGLTSASLVRTIREAAGEALREATVVDRYDRPPVPPGRVSVTVTLRYQAERTLTGEEVQRSIEGVVERLRSMGAEVRGLQEG
jgi:phenylalanyl-tRNA synthetase beta chain